jgi:phosphatidate cytidylyltransferase
LFLLISGAAIELVKLSKPAVYSRVVMFLSGITIALSFTFGQPDSASAVFIVVILTGVFFLFFVKQKENLSTFVRDIGIHFTVVFYLYFPLYYIFKLKVLHPHYLFFLVFVIAVGDSAAYFLGRAFGKHKIYPLASPRKSLEGLVAGVIFAAAAGWAAIRLFPVPGHVGVGDWLVVATGGIIGLLSQISDPIESLFKRAAQKKDSGSLLPGHGGLLDRVDSYIFCAPALFYIILYSW